jgi:hypothetical protein
MDLFRSKWVIPKLSPIQVAKFNVIKKIICLGLLIFIALGKQKSHSLLRGDFRRDF